MVGIVTALFFLKVLSSHGWDPLVFVLLTPGNTPVGQTWNVGYDGRFSYHLAINPLGATEGLDEPNYRYQRILFPLIVKLLSFGQPSLVPWMMILLNLGATILAAKIIGEMLIRRKVSPMWGGVLFFSIGYLLALRMDLLEPLALALALGGWLAKEKDRPGWAILLFALASLAKDIALLFPVALAVVDFANGYRGRALLLAFASCLPYLMLFVFLANHFGMPIEAIEKSRLLIVPLAGYAAMQDVPSKIVVSLWAIAPAVAGGSWAAIEVLRQRFAASWSGDAMLVIACAGLLVILPQPTWLDPLAILRLATGLIAALLLWFAAHHRRWLPFAAALWLPSCLVLVLVPGIL